MDKKILIVEDIPDILQILRIEVRELGYQTLVARNGKEAVKMASSEVPDLIMMDIMMPEIDGFEAARLIRQNPKTFFIPIIAVTAKSRFKDKEKCLKNGFNDYISKPFTPLQLAIRIKKLLKEQDTQP